MLRAVDTQNLYAAVRVFNLKNGYLVEFVNRSHYADQATVNHMEFYRTPKEVADAIVRQYTTNVVMGNSYDQTTVMKGNI
jgi:hypothetical protein